MSISLLVTNLSRKKKELRLRRVAKSPRIRCPQDTLISGTFQQCQ